MRQVLAMASLAISCSACVGASDGAGAGVFGGGTGSSVVHCGACTGDYSCPPGMACDQKTFVCKTPAEIQGGGIYCDADCKNHPNCTKQGWCTATAGQCQSSDASTDPCAKSCKSVGACSFKYMSKGIPVCDVGSAKDCAASDACKSFGACDKVIGCIGGGSPFCSPTYEDNIANQSCKSSDQCKESGRCTFVAAINRNPKLSKCGGKTLAKCVVGSSSDCKQSDACKNEGACTLGPQGYCICKQKPCGPLGTECKNPNDCDDKDGCTVDTCKKGKCEHEPKECSFPKDKCSWGLKCIAGQCTGGQSKFCNDQNPCTKDWCKTEADGCKNESLPDGTSCGDGKSCANGVCK